MYMYVELKLSVWSKSLYLGKKFTLYNFFYPALILIFKQRATLHLCMSHHLYLAVQNSLQCTTMYFVIIGEIFPVKSLQS